MRDTHIMPGNTVHKLIIIMTTSTTHTHHSRDDQTRQQQQQQQTLPGTSILHSPFSVRSAGAKGE